VKRFSFLILFFSLLTIDLYSQELFPNTEPASTMPKGAVGVRVMYETYKELPSQRIKYWDGLRLMYGATSKLTVMLTASASNHHLKKFPGDLSNYFRNHHSSSFKPYPFLFEGFNLYAKYRVLSFDGQQKHLRIALYGEVAKAFNPHDEAEPSFQGDNTGYGGGLIATQLYKRFAFSVTTGFIHPLLYKDPSQHISFQTGEGTMYNVSIGYRFLPVTYNDYKNVNINFYLEFINKSYDNAILKRDGVEFNFIPYQYLAPYIYNSLQSNKYSEMRPSVQFIFNSNERIDIGIATPVYNRSYQHFYPMFFFHFQKYFYGKKKASEMNNKAKTKS
jgi:hypothetical protein